MPKLDPADGRGNCVENVDKYRALYRESMEDHDGFWLSQGLDRLRWSQAPTETLEFNAQEAQVRWFPDGRLNSVENCLQRRLETHKDKVAFYWEAIDPSLSHSVTYGELAARVNRLAALLRDLGLGKGDRVVVYMPNTVEAVEAMLACGALGAVHCVVGIDYGVEALAYRIPASGASFVITMSCIDSASPLSTVKRALPQSDVPRVLYFGEPVDESPGCIALAHALESYNAAQPVSLEPGAGDDPLFLLFASPAIGKPRGLVHAHGGWLLWAAMIRDYLFAFDESDVFWATTDLDRINGHALTVYGTLLNGGTAVIFEGGPNYPDPARYWETIAKYGVNKFCANSALIRACAAAGMNPAAQFDLSSLEIIGTAGEPLYPPEWEWFSENVGAARRPIIATWGQAETGGPLLSPIPGMVAGRPGSVSVPFFGVDPVILDLDTGEEAKFPNQEGALFLRRPWPGMAVTIQGDHEGYREAYFAPFAPGWFLTGEGALKDEDGFYRITGRMDDIINCAGFRMGAWELETALGDDDDVAEAGVVGFPHSIKGQGLYAFVKLESGVDKAPDLVDRLRESMADRFGKPAVPDVIQWVDALPKTRSGKILRRLLQKIAAGSINMGDLSTVADKKVVEKLIAERPTDIE